MKDITDDIHKTILGNAEETDERRKIKVLGEDTRIPHDVFKSFVEKTSYFEINNLDDILRDYKKFSEHGRGSMGVMKWIIGIAKTSYKHKKFRDELARLQSIYGADYNRIVGRKTSFFDKLTMKIMPKRILYLTEMNLDNFEAFEYPLFSAQVFDINDKYGNKIKGVRITEHFVQNMMVNEEREAQTNEKLKDIKSGSERPFLMQCSAVNSDVPCLIVRHMQEGGKKVGIPEITI